MWVSESFKWYLSGSRTGHSLYSKVRTNAHLNLMFAFMQNGMFDYRESAHICSAFGNCSMQLVTTKNVAYLNKIIVLGRISEPQNICRFILVNIVR